MRYAFFGARELHSPFSNKTTKMLLARATLQNHVTMSTIKDMKDFETRTMRESGNDRNGYEHAIEAHEATDDD